MTGVLIAATVAAALLLWAKWLPYAGKVPGLATGHTWSGSSILGTGGVQPGDAPSWSAATSFTRAYSQAVWRALLAALLISAALQTLVPRAWLLRVLNRPGRLRAAVAGGVASTPSMMCACCTAPVVVGLRRSGVSTSAVVAYWLGNPLLNPAVLIFLGLVAPWQWTLTRIVVGVLVVVAGSALVARLAEARTAPAGPEAETPDPPVTFGRYLRVLVRMAVVLIPEYLVVIMLVGAFRGWLFPLDAAGSGLLVVLVAAIVGTAMVIPTAGEIPIAQGLALAGLSLGAVGALLITLPAVSLPGAAMVWRAFGWKVTLATAAVVVIGGLTGAAVLELLPA
ncbi:permease [Paractinoplanes abujensis]|uniref:Uncharacterized membrane protein YraQ (UPF0718 family) n=1 Tax=Paractinoplanes abujensis TaxID=882441 RepID=A0A7W7CRM1_9ACTN|nr:permease [Actinoplanes abujensis]MBB4693094.1 uncharacterized membrane protein YraQ (UPF0718 family) [Actinoplanes abujensis]